MKIRKIIKTNTYKNIISLGSATLIKAVLALLVGISTRNMLGPEQYGYWITISLIFTFTPLFQLGTLNAMNREVPFYLERKNLKKVQEIRDSVFSFLFTLPLFIVILLLFISSLIYFKDIDVEYKTGLFLAAFIVFLNYLSSYVEMYFKSQQDFKLTSNLITTKSVAKSFFTLILVFLIGYEGMYLGMIIAIAFQVILARKVISIHRRKFTFSQYKKLIKIGFPILLVGIVWNLMIASDKFILTIFMTPEDLGNYSVGTFVFTTLMLVPQVLTQIFYPKIVRLISRNKIMEIRKLYWRVNKYLSLIMLIIVFVSYLLIPYFIKWFMPEYVEGTTAAQMLIFGIYPLTLVQMAGNYFNSTNNQKVYVSIQLICLLLNFLLSILLLNKFNSINSVALATSVTFYVYFVLMNGVFLIKSRGNSTVS
ncbi:oligosaccharide flippase family protein [Salirhabdus salicampi]|uniref:oligosaccharide flippase family protein n=1 Tax=Salirhabdus salicampi TaxID=476102 RepID=UPI0020C50F6B|nr:oligosaccharide flippase family protein [Salirhabdus salicampi]MCP8617528.1 oligosaccharide flippase family protein [Salirhabdus salicampi]